MSSNMDDIVSALPEWMQYSGRHPEVTLGPWLLGILFDFLLQGVILTQVRPIPA